MADSAVVITSGTGTNIDTRTESTNGNHRQVVTIGDPSTNAGVAPVDGTAGLKVDLGTDNDVTVSGSVAVTNAGITTIAGAVSGTEMQVDIVTSALPTGASTSAKQDTIIGHVDGIETLIGTTNTTLTTIDGRVDGVEGLLTTIDGDTGNIVTSVQLLDDTVATDGAATPTKGVLIAGQDGTNAQTVKTDSDGNLQVDVLTMPSTTVTATDLDIRNLTNVDVVTAELSATDNAVLDTIDAVLDTINAKLVSGTDIGDVTINNAAGASAVNIQDGGNTITVDGTVAVTNSDITSIKTAVEILDNAISGNEMQVDVLTMPTVTVDLGANNDVGINAGTNAIGKLLPPDVDVTAHSNYAKKFYTSAGAATDGIVWSPAAGKRWHAVVIHFQVSADCTVTIEDDKAGGDEVVWKGEYKAGSGHTLTFSEKYPLASGEDAADLLITTSAGNIYLLAVGYEV